MTARTPSPSTLTLLGLTLVIAVTSPTMAQAPRAGIVTAAQGDVSAARTGLSARIPLKFKDDVFLQDRIEAGDGAFAKILPGGKALVTVRERSVVTITEVPGRATVELGRGQAVLSLGKSLLAPGEAVEIRTPSAIAAVRGSTVYASVGDTETIAAFAVSRPVLVSLQSNPGVFVELTSYQMLNVVGIGSAASFSPIRSVPPGLLKYFEQPKTGHVQQLPDKVVEQFQQTAANAGNQGDPFPPGLGSPKGFGAYESVCQNSPSSCAPPLQAPGPPPGPPLGPPQIQNQPVSLGPPPGQPPGPPPPGPPPAGPPPPPSLGTPSFKPPGAGGPQPFQPFPGGGLNLPPGHGGIPPGQLKK